MDRELNLARKGRPPGATNLASRRFKEFCDLFFSSEEWRVSAVQRMVAGTAPHLETYLLQMTYGKPVEKVNLRVEVADDLSALSAEELLSRADELRDQLLEMAATEKALEAEFRIEPDSQSEDGQ